MTDDEIVSGQLEFFARNLSGCAFAAHAARNPSDVEWRHRLVRADELPIMDEIISEAVACDGVSTLELIFPDVQTDNDLDQLIPALNGDVLYLYETEDTAASRCFRYRAKVGAEESLVSGFGPFDSMPITRRSPSASIVMRVKERPTYKRYMKTPVPGLTHIADMRIPGFPQRWWDRMWRNSHFRTRSLLGHEPDEESAARTTFVIPLVRADQIAL